MRRVSISSDPKVNLLLFRCLSNLAAHHLGSRLLLQFFNKSSTELLFKEIVESKGVPNVQIALATLLLNASVLIVRDGYDEGLFYIVILFFFRS